MTMEFGGLRRSSRCWLGGVVAVLSACVLAAHAGGTEAESSDLERALGAPIIPGETAAGVRLGDDREALARTLGAADTVETFTVALLEMNVYRKIDLTRKTMTMILVTFTIGQRGADSITIISDRQPPTPFTYLGRTSQGYRMGESAERLKRLHGEPDVVFTRPPDMRSYYWYRSLGLLVSPEARETDYTEAQISIVKPNISRDEVERLVFPK